jgi:hypothetical protein
LEQVIEMMNEKQPANMWSGRFRELLDCTFATICVLSIAMLSGCHAKPDQIVTTPSPDSSVFYTVETFRGDGPLSSGSTDVYAHLKAGSDIDRKLVLHGLYLNTRVTWTDRDNADLCLAGGLTSEFYNEVTLNAGKAYKTIHNHLKENC